MKSITVFTPSFNRAHLLPRLYESLKNQTSKDFVWMVIDDGSTDNTKSLVAQWREEADFEIQYHYKKNGGMHTAHNLAYSLIDTELNVCIDSDDYMPANAIELCISNWQTIDRKEEFAGIIGLDASAFNGKIIGSKFPENVGDVSLYEMTRTKYGVSGDKKMILQTKIVKQYPQYPEFEGERLVPLGLLYHMIGWDYKFLFSNEIYCFVEYQENGSSNTIFKQYFRSPRGFSYERNIRKQFSKSLKDDLINSMHLGVSTIITKDLSIMNSKPKAIYNYIMFPFAILFYFYLRLQTK